LFEPSQPRACSISLLRGLIPKDFGNIVAEGVITRIEEYLDETPENQTILVTGSIYLIGEYLSITGEASTKDQSGFQDLL